MLAGKTDKCSNFSITNSTIAITTLGVITLALAIITALKWNSDGWSKTKKLTLSTASVSGFLTLFGIFCKYYPNCCSKIPRLNMLLAFKSPKMSESEKRIKEAQDYLNSLTDTKIDTSQAKCATVQRTNIDASWTYQFDPETSSIVFTNCTFENIGVVANQINQLKKLSRLSFENANIYPRIEFFPDAFRALFENLPESMEQVHFFGNVMVENFLARMLTKKGFQSTQGLDHTNNHPHLIFTKQIQL